MTTQYVRSSVSLTRNQHTSHTVNADIHQVLVVDCETTMDYAQSLRLAGYCLYDLDQATTLAKGLIVDHTHLSAIEYETLRNYAVAHQLGILDRYTFVETILYPLLAQGVALVNHNIPFDLGCLASSFVGIGKTFYLKLCSCNPTGDNAWRCANHPPIAVRGLSFPKAMIYVDSPLAYGAILDTMTIGRALLGPGDMSLKGMGTRFKCETVKHISDEHGNELTDSYLDYTMRDVQATLELFIAEIAEYKRHGLAASIAGIMSEASIGKAYLHQLGIPAFVESHTEIPDWLYPTAMRAYYGARSEVKIRLQPTEIRYCDFKSQYPTVNALLGLQELLLAQYISVKHVTTQVQRFLELITLDDLQSLAVWKKLRILVKFSPGNDIVPTKFSTVDDLGDKQTGYAVCYVTGQENWYSLCDAVASKLLTGKAPQIIDAIAMYPTGQVATNTLDLFGDSRYSIDLTADDFFTKVIDLRTDVKNDLQRANQAGDSDQAHYLDSLQLALKLLANSTSYGVLVETRYEQGVETAGKYYASPIAVHITAAARLLLAIAERLGRDRGLEYAMCDTDSMAYARPNGMDRTTFHSLVNDIIAWFTPLSPYTDKAALFELEHNEHAGIDTPLYFLGVSCKRYALYNRLDNGTYRLRKVSAHATGRFQFDKDLPLPTGVPYPTIKGKVWQYLLWYQAIEQAEKGITAITIADDLWSNNIVRYQESISTPGKLKQYSYLPGVRPYSFFTATPAIPGYPHRYVMPYKPTHQAIMECTPHITKTMRCEANPTYDTLMRRFDTFFTHTESKVANGKAVGILQRRSLAVDVTVERTRTGKKVVPGATDTSPSLWNMEV